MKNSKLRRILLTLACAVLLVSLSVGATLAYLTSTTDVVTNTFTVGKVKIDLDEAPVDLYGVKTSTAVEDRIKANTYKLVPGHEYSKDPIVHVKAESEPCWLFVKINDQIAAIQDEDTIVTQLDAKGWVALDGVDGVYYYEDIVDARTEQKDIPVFEEFTIKGDADVASYANKTITVQAYAVQADGFDTAADAWAAATPNWTPDAN